MISSRKIPVWSSQVQCTLFPEEGDIWFCFSWTLHRGFCSWRTYQIILHDHIYDFSKKKIPLHADVYESVPSPLNRAYYMAVYCHLAVDTGQTRSVDKLLLTCDNVILFAWILIFTSFKTLLKQLRFIQTGRDA